MGMARPLRIAYPGAVYHVMNRGQSRRQVFLEDAGRQNFLTFSGILKAVKEHGYSQVEVARHLKLHYTTVSWIIRRIANVQQ
jgi:hypothetical protein